MPARMLPVCFHIIRNVRIENVGKYQSCMVSKLQIIWKQTVPVFGLISMIIPTAAPALIAPDKDGSGDITAAEIAAGLEAMHASIPEERLEHMMLAIGA